MSTKVAVLPDILANKIAAGEVVERPASVVKELVENSLDAGASKIVVEASRGGKAFMRVSDDGEGMSQADALLSLERHATSKISSEQDIYRVRTLGFRGEALPSIAAVCKLRIVTKEVETLSGTVIDVEGGKIVSVKDGGCPVGTVVEAKNIFFNIPARLKFLKSAQTEFSHIAEVVSRLALAHPQVQFQLLHNGQKVFDLAKTEDLKERMGELIGREARGQLLPFEVKEGYLQVKGYTSHPSFTRSRPNGIHVFINRRFVKDRLLTRAMYEAYRNIIPRERYPVALLMVEADPAAVDVNVHPTKSEVRFREPNFIYQKVLAGVRAGLSQVATPPKPAAELKSWDSMRERRWQPRERGYQEQGPPASFLAETSEEERIVSLLPRGFFSSLQIIGQAKNSFIICQSDTQLVL
ncbi:MAG: DNA mismatch repair endonuclease MutL, partial [Thermodesulfobacteriota bacterium]